MPKYTYGVEIRVNGAWAPVLWLRGESRSFCTGYVMGRHDQPGVCLPSRVVRSDGKMIYESLGAEDESIGLIAGWPTPEQYEAAAERALASAERVRRLHAQEPRSSPSGEGEQ